MIGQILMVERKIDYQTGRHHDWKIDRLNQNYKYDLLESSRQNQHLGGAATNVAMHGAVKQKEEM